MSARPKLLDLFCCQGGASEGYRRAGFDVYGNDIDPQPRYPFMFTKGDALLTLRRLLAGDPVPFGDGTGRLDWMHLWDFDAIHASPPCQTFTAYRRRGAGVGDSYLNLIPETRELLERTGLPWVIENVEGARGELRESVRVCGSSFGLDVRRHRLFESSEAMSGTVCDHAWQTPRFPPATNRTNLRRTVEVGVWRIPLNVQQDAMGGLEWMTLRGLSEAIPPAYTEFIGTQLLASLSGEVTA
ncbi:MAG TPA: DNA cytosine methyltransferase [Microbacteriaceae bacterium]|nr:DNA cytosine methyltransferase [Microbacteriaceae bacterium]